MDRENIAAYIISGTDPHNSEYLPAPWQQRKWISGFTGSYGTVVVTKNEAGLWTDTRYFIQAEKELAGSGIKLHKLRVPDAVDYPQWLVEVLESGTKVGIDGFCMSVSDVRNLKNALSPKNITIQKQIDLLGEMWFDRSGSSRGENNSVWIQNMSGNLPEKESDKFESLYAIIMVTPCYSVVWMKSPGYIIFVVTILLITR